MHFTTIATISITVLAFVCHGVSASPQNPNQLFKRAEDTAPDTTGSSGGDLPLVGEVARHIGGLFPPPPSKPQDPSPKTDDDDKKD
jgi:hypothetical protein